MHTSTTIALAACIALGSVCASAQTGAPAAGGDPATGSAPPRSAGTSPQNPSVNGYKDSKPENSASDKARPRQDAAGGGSAMPSDPTGKDSMAKDNMPRHPAADTKKTP